MQRLCEEFHSKLESFLRKNIELSGFIFQMVFICRLCMAVFNKVLNMCLRACIPVVNFQLPEYSKAEF